MGPLEELSDFKLLPDQALYFKYPLLESFLEKHPSSRIALSRTSRVALDIACITTYADKEKYDYDVAGMMSSPLISAYGTPYILLWLKKKSSEMEYSEFIYILELF